MHNVANVIGSTEPDFLRLLAWYRASGRDLPWRRTQDPYALMVSELMLQQTRVETVLRFYARFLERFPTAAALANAPEEDVLAAWAGLGYYRRARLLQKAAIKVQHGFPTTEQELREVPGIGDYTAASLASIGFGHKAVALDGNALRVLTRYFGEEGDPLKNATKKRLKALTLPHIPDGDAGDFTQSVMELGASLCAPRPRCGECPLHGCVAKRERRQHEIPAPRKSKPQVEVQRTVIWAQDDGRTLLISEPEAPILQGFWQLPYWEDDSFRPYFGALVPLGQLKHGITFRKMTLTVYGAGKPTRPLPWELQRWVKGPEEVPVPAFVRKIMGSQSLSGSRAETL